MNKNFFQNSIKDSLLTGLIALALFGPIVGLRTVAVNEALDNHINGTSRILPQNGEKPLHVNFI